MSSLKYVYLLLSPLESGVNRRLILWSRQLCNHSAKGQILPERKQIHLPVILFSLKKVNSGGNVVHIHMQQTEKEFQKWFQRLREITLKGKKRGPPLSTGLIALLFFKTHFKKKGGGKEEFKICSAHLGRNLPCQTVQSIALRLPLLY